MKFIEEIAPIVQKLSSQLGYKYPSAIIAQACIESNFGKSLLSSKYHNYFGLKCGSSWKGKSINLKTKEEYTAGTLTTIRDNFRVYTSMYDGVAGYFDFIKYRRYSNLKSATSPRDYIAKIVQDGYCTSKTYINSCCNLIAKYNLTQYDKEEGTNGT